MWNVVGKYTDVAHAGSSRVELTIIFLLLINPANSVGPASFQMILQLKCGEEKLLKVTSHRSGLDLIPYMTCDGIKDMAKRR